MATLAENAAAVKAAQVAIDAAIVAKGGTTDGGLNNAAAAIAALPSGDEEWEPQGGWPTDNVSRIYIHLDEYDSLDYYVKIAYRGGNNGYFQIDWGDGTVEPFNTVRKTHTYSAPGDYVIKIERTAAGLAADAKYYHGAYYHNIFGAGWNELGEGDGGRSATVIGLYISDFFAWDTAHTSSGGRSDFCYLPNLKGVKINGFRFDVVDGKVGIGSFSFIGCTSLRSLTIPQGVTSIGASAFSYCYALRSLTIPQGVTSIGSSAFSNCTSLRSLTIPQGVTSIGTSAFGSCTALSNIVIPDTVETIESKSFNGCRSATKIVIGSGCHTIGDGAFRFNGTGGSQNNYTVVCHALTPPNLGGSTVFNNAENVTIFVPYSADHSVLDTYKLATNWSAYASKIRELNEDGTTPEV